MRKSNRKNGRNFFGEKAELKYVVLEKGTAKDVMLSALLDVAKKQREHKMIEYTFDPSHLSKEEAESLFKWFGKMQKLVAGYQYH